MRCLCEAVVQHIKLKSEGNTIQASLLVRFLHQHSAGTAVWRQSDQTLPGCSCLVGTNVHTCSPTKQLCRSWRSTCSTGLAEGPICLRWSDAGKDHSPRFFAAIF